jgi:hypothetical protein
MDRSSSMRWTTSVTPLRAAPVVIASAESLLAVLVFAASTFDTAVFGEDSG